MRILARSATISLLLAGLVLVIVLAGSLLFLGQQAHAAPQQPIPFPHVSMVGAGVPCLYCHSGALTSEVAGIPSVDSCMGCHTVIDPTKPDIQKLAAYAQREQPIQWVRIYQLPRFVRFAHGVHIARGLNCEQCHGDVGHMDVTVQAKKLNMGFCLDCHERQLDGEQLKDCGVCHY